MSSSKESEAPRRSPRTSDLVKWIWILSMVVLAMLCLGVNYQLPQTPSIAYSDAPVYSSNEGEEPPVCLSHAPMHVNASNKNKLDNPNVTLVEHSQGCGRLRRDWTSNPPLSKLARDILKHQSNCSMPVATFHVDNLFGLGSHVALWSQAMCNAWQDQTRMRTYNPDWLWLDQTHCNLEQAKQSPLLCYFPQAEFLCGNQDDDESPFVRNVSDPRDKRYTCNLLRDDPDLKSQFRAASTEYLFRAVSPLVLQEAQRQVGILFGDQVPNDLIAVHIRWGDKFWEMDLAPLQEYRDAISTLLWENFGSNDTANLFVATEDPRVVEEFRNSTPPGWKVYYDPTVEELGQFRPRKGNRASWMAKNTKGRAGLVGLGSLLVAMEANYFVLTTKSNWSRLMNHLRTNVIDPRCGNCTRMIDLRPGEW